MSTQNAEQTGYLEGRIRHSESRAMGEHSARGGDIAGRVDRRRADTVAIHLDRSVEDPLSRYGLEQLVQAAGLRYRFLPCARPTLYYGSNPTLGRAAGLWIPAAPRSVIEAAQPEVVCRDDMPVLWPTDDADTPAVGNRIFFDVARATAFWLTLNSERRAAARDEHDRVPGDASLLGTLGRLHQPPVQQYAQRLANHLRPYLTPAAIASRWPAGKRYAVALTHDVDLPEVPRKLYGHLRRMIRPAARSRRETYWEIRAELRSHGVREALLAPHTKRRHWDFAALQSTEDRYGLRSAFYFAVVNRKTGHARDVSYDASRMRYRNLFRRLRSRGWEIGLHASYETRRGRPDVRVQVNRLSVLSGGRVDGVRHHYLMLDRDDPIRTLDAHAEAGLLYDTSIGFNDRPGFRAGTALPFVPFCPSRGGARRFIELPMTLADMHLPSHDAEAAVRCVRDHLDTVREVGGLAVLNWHVGHRHSDPAWSAAYEAACRFVGEDPGAWVTTPREISEWWLKPHAEPNLG